MGQRFQNYLKGKNADKFKTWKQPDMKMKNNFYKSNFYQEYEKKTVTVKERITFI